MTKVVSPFIRSLLLASALTLSLGKSAFAAADLWVGSTTINWSDTTGAGFTTAPVAGFTPTFGAAGAAGTSLNDDLANGFSVNGITFSLGASPYVITGNSLTLAGNISNLTTTGTEEIDDALTLSATRSVTGAIGSTTVLGGVISGGFGFTINTNNTAPTGIVKLSGANIYTGTTTLTAGTLVLNTSEVASGSVVTSGAIGTGTLALNGGSLQAGASNGNISNAVTITNNSIINGSNNVTFTSGGSFTNSGGNRTLTNNNTATTTLAGPIFLSESATTGRTLTLAGTGAGGVVTGAISNFNSGAGTASGLTINGGTGGVWQLNNGNSTYTGNTTLTAGTLQIGASTTSVGGVVTKGPVGTGNFLIGTAILQAVNGSQTIGNQIVFNGNVSPTISGSNSFDFTGPASWGGSQTLTVSNPSTTFDGTFTLRGGTGESGDLANPVGQRSVTLAGTGNTIFNGAIVNGTTLNGIVTINNTGITSLNGNNSFSGVLGIGAGATAKLGNANGLGFGGISAVASTKTVSNGGVLDLNGQQNVNAAIILNGSGIANGGALINSNTTTTAIISNGLASIGVGAAGSGYDAAPTVTFTGAGSGTATAYLGITAATLGINTASGTYTTAPTITITGGGGTGATATINTAGVVTIASTGFGYTSTPTVTITGGTLATGAAWTSTPTGNNYAVVGYQVTSAGTGATALNPVATVTSVDANGTGATATANSSSVALASASSIGGAGNIQIDAAISGAFPLTKVGAGTVLLTNGSNSYSGGTTIGAGNVVAKAQTGSSTGTGVVTVNGTGRLGGNGVIAPTAIVTGTAVDIQSGGKLSPSLASGVGFSQLTFNLNAGANVTLEAGSKLEFNLNTPTDSDWINILGGTLALNGQQFSDFNFIAEAGFDTGVYTLISTAAPNDITGALGTTLTGVINGHAATLGLDANNQNLILTVAVPEPGTWALMLGGLGLLVLMQRTRKERRS